MEDDQWWTFVMCFWGWGLLHWSHNEWHLECTRMCSIGGKVKYCFLLENKNNTQPQLLHAHILEQKPQVKYDVNTSSSCSVQQKPGVGNHIECSKIRGREEWNIGGKEHRFFGDCLGFFYCSQSVFAPFQISVDLKLSLAGLDNVR